MAVGFASYEIARSGMVVSERGLFVTGQNLSNVNTPGYVRQQAMIADSIYTTDPTGYGVRQLGLGADIQQTRQIRHTFLDTMYRRESTSMGYWDTRSQALQDVQDVLAEPVGEGLQAAMNQFWNSWQELSKAPDSLTTRALVKQRADSLVQYINHMGQQLDKQQYDLDVQIQNRIGEANGMTADIARLNTLIMQEEVSGNHANDYRDQRNLLLDKLSGLMEIEATEMEDGQVMVMASGNVLVNQGRATQLYAGQTPASGIFHVPMLAGTTTEMKISGGILKGLLESRGEVPGLKGSLANGSPCTKADLVFAVDISNGNDLTNLQNNIASFVSQLEKSGTGIDYNIKLVTFGDSVTTVGTYDMTSLTAFETAVSGLTAQDATHTENNFTSLVSALNTSIPLRDDAVRQMMVFTGESIGGNEAPDVTGAQAAALATTLSGLGVRTSVVTDSAYFDTGTGTELVGWKSITQATAGTLYDNGTPAADFAGLMSSMASDSELNFNASISVVGNSLNIIPTIRKQLNALINIMVREVNNLHSSGKTLDNQDAGDFFTTIDSAYPMEMGNLKLNLSDLNDIAASVTGEKGDNSLAQQIANLRNDTLARDVTGKLSLDGYYRSIILRVGNEGAEAAGTASSQQQLVQAADAKRQSISGVSMDEEMANMLKYKFAYNASSRAINVIDQMLETIIARMGLVGR